MRPARPRDGGATRGKLPCGKLPLRVVRSTFYESLEADFVCVTPPFVRTRPLSCHRCVDPVQGRRILVLSLQGNIMQVFTHQTDPTAMFTSICWFDHKLLAYYDSENGAGMLTLQGL